MSDFSQFSPKMLKSLNNYILSVGEVNELHKFVVEVLSGLQKFIGFDSGTVYLFNENGKVIDWHLFQVNSSWNEVYLSYYYRMSTTEQMNFGMFKEGTLIGRPVDWSKVPDSEFVLNYVRNRELKHSLHFCLQDTNSMARTLFALDRMQNIPFSSNDIDKLQFLVPHLNNLHKKFFLIPKSNHDSVGRKRALMQMAGLTKREMEITLRLCAGTSPTNISKALHIAPATTHKHITHIYEKLRVSNLQELLVYLLNPQG